MAAGWCLQLDAVRSTERGGWQGYGGNAGEHWKTDLDLHEAITKVRCCPSLCAIRVAPADSSSSPLTASQTRF